MLDRKILILVIILGVGTMLFMYNNLFIPLHKHNKGLSREVNRFREEVKAVDRLSRKDSRGEGMIERIRKFDEVLNLAIPDELSIPQLNDMLVASLDEYGAVVTSLSFGTPEITSTKGSSAMGGAEYIVMDVDFNLRLAMDHLVKYLAWIENNSRYIGIEALAIEPSRVKSGNVEAKLNLKAYAFSRDLISMDEADLADTEALKPVALDENYIREVLRLPQREKIDASQYVTGSIFARAGEAGEAGPISMPFEGTFDLKGVVLKESKGSIALINNALVKEGDSLQGYKVHKIEEKRVLLEKNGDIFTLDIKRQQ